MKKSWYEKTLEEEAEEEAEETHLEERFTNSIRIEDSRNDPPPSVIEAEVVVNPI